MYCLLLCLVAFFVACFGYPLMKIVSPIASVPYDQHPFYAWAFRMSGYRGRRMRFLANVLGASVFALGSAVLIFAGAYTSVELVNVEASQWILRMQLLSFMAGTVVSIVLGEMWVHRIESRYKARCAAEKAALESAAVSAEPESETLARIRSIIDKPRARS